MIKAEAKDLGFFACGIAEACPTDIATATAVRRWIEKGAHAGMAYMAANMEKRLDPRLLMPGAKSMVCVALNYAPALSLPESEPRISAYALGKDYHDIVKDKLRQLAARLQLTPYGQEGDISYRIFCDTAPVLERYWAQKAGLGWIGRNHQLIIPHAGSMFFLGEMLLDITLEYDSQTPNRCGKCHACLDACPTGALRKDTSGTKGNGLPYFASSLCISYQTIENRGEIPRHIAEKMQMSIYGCDRCQTACPWNRFASPTGEPLLQPSEELQGMTMERWNRLTVEEYRRLFKGSAVKRTKYEGLTRNIRIVNDNIINKRRNNGKG